MYKNNILLERQIADREAEKIKDTAKKENRGLTKQEEEDIATLTTRGTELKTLSEAKRIDQKTAQSFTDPKVAGLALEGVMKQTGIDAKSQELNEQRRNVLIDTRVKVKAAELAQDTQKIKNEQTLLALDSKIFDLATNGFEYLTDAEMKRKNILETEKLFYDQTVARKTVEDEIGVLTEKLKDAKGPTIAGLKSEIDLKLQQLNQLDEQATKEYTILGIQQRQAATTNTYAIINKAIREGVELSQLQRDTDIDRTNNELDLFQQRVQLLNLTGDQYLAEEKL